MKFDTNNLDYKEINSFIRTQDKKCVLENCCGQRFIAAGMSEKKIVIDGVPGNALGAYLNGAEITVNGNAQDAVGDTMNDGMIVINGNIGDAAGYAMRGGKIYVRGNAGYRAGIHMKEYKEKVPLMIIGGTTGSFLGEYQAGGIIIVLNLENRDRIVSNFTCTGMHGGKVFLRGNCKNIVFPSQVTARKATKDDLKELKAHIREYCKIFDIDIDKILSSPFTVVTPDSKNPYKQMYVANWNLTHKPKSDSFFEQAPDRIPTKPYLDARKLLTQAENYTHLDEIEALYEEALARAE